MISLNHYLLLSGVLFSLGVLGVLTRKNALVILMSVELMLNAVNINLLAFWAYRYAGQMNGLVFVAIVFAAAAAEAAVGLALIISVYRRRTTVIADELNLMKG